MYTPIRVRTLDEQTFTNEGHAYDLSEGGLQLELDRPIDPGTPVAVELTLHGSQWEDSTEPSMGLSGRSLFLFGNVVWLDDEEAGPARMAIAITRFTRPGEREKFIRQLYSGRLARAA